MGSYYHEPLPDEIASIMLGKDYSSKNTYRLIQDREGSYIAGFDKETGEKVDLANNLDGIPDDLKLDIEEFEFCKDEIDREEEKDNNEYTSATFGMLRLIIPLTLITILMSSIYIAFLILR